MEPSGDIINVLIEGKEHLITVSEHKCVTTIGLPSCGKPFGVLNWRKGRSGSSSTGRITITP